MKLRMDERMGGSIRYPYSGQGVSRVLTSRRKLQFCQSCCDHMLKGNKAHSKAKCSYCMIGEIDNLQ